MTKIFENLFVGTVSDIGFTAYAFIPYSILGACKEPLHRSHARLRGKCYDGYTGRAIPKDEPEYYFAERDHALYLNLIDARDPAYIPDICIEKAIEFIEKETLEGRNVLIVCNKGESRSPAIAFLYLVTKGIINCSSFSEALDLFVDSFYPYFNPGNGILGYYQKYFERLKKE